MAGERSLARARIKIVADARGLGDDVKREAGKAGKEAGDAFSDRMNREMEEGARKYARTRSGQERVQQAELQAQAVTHFSRYRSLAEKSQAEIEKELKRRRIADQEDAFRSYEDAEKRRLSIVRDSEEAMTRLHDQALTDDLGRLQVQARYEDAAHNARERLLDRERAEHAKRAKAAAAEEAKEVGFALNQKLRDLKEHGIAEIDIKGDASDVDRKIKETKLKLLALAAHSHDIKIRAKVTEARGELDAFQSLISGASKAGLAAGREFGLSTFTSMKAVLETPVLGPILVGAAAAAAALAAPVLASLLASAVIGGAGIGGMVGGIMLAARDPRVVAAANDFSSIVMNRLENAASGFVQPVLSGLDTIRAALDTVNFERILGNASKFVEPLAASVASMVTSIGGGLDALVANAGPVVDAIAKGLANTADLIGRLMRMLAEDGPAAASAIDGAFKALNVTLLTVVGTLQILIESYGFLAKIGAFGRDAQLEYIRLEANKKIEAEKTKQAEIANTTAAEGIALAVGAAGAHVMANAQAAVTEEFKKSAAEALGFKRAIITTGDDLSGQLLGFKPATVTIPAKDDKDAKNRQAAAARRQAADGIRDALSRIAPAEEAVGEAQERAKDAQEKLTQARKDAVEQLKELREAVHDGALEEETASTKVAKAYEARRILNEHGKASAVEQREANNNIKRAEEELRDTKRGRAKDEKDLKDAERKGVELSPQVVAAKRAQRDAERGILKAQRDLKKAQQDVTDARLKSIEVTDNATGAVSRNSYSLSANSLAGLENRGKIRGMVKANEDLYTANVNSGMSADDARVLYDNNAKAIENAAVKAGFNKDQVHSLVVEWGNLPPAKTTKVSITGFDETFRKLTLAHLLQQEMLSPGTKHTRAQIEQEAINRTNAANNPMAYQYRKNLGFGEKATGGRIFGPGTATSDSIPTLLSRGEWVQPAHAVDFYGDNFMEAVRQHRIPKLAGGGSWPFNVDVSKTYIPAYAAGGPLRDDMTGRVALVAGDQEEQIVLLRRLLAAVERLGPEVGGAVGHAMLGTVPATRVAARQRGRAR